MDQTKIGRFIAETRRESGMTQAQLAERVGVSDKAVSKWERGLCLPDAGHYEDVCAALGLTVSELLAGERIGGEERPARAEAALVAVAKESEQRRRTDWQLSALIGMGCGMSIGTALIENGWIRLLWWLGAAAVIILGLIRLRRAAGPVIRGIRVCTLMLMGMAILCAADLGNNYLYNLMYEFHDGSLTLAGWLSPFLYPDYGWTLEAFYWNFSRAASIAVWLIAVNIALACGALLGERE